MSVRTGGFVSRLLGGESTDVSSLTARVAAVEIDTTTNTSDIATNATNLTTTAGTVAANTSGVAANSAAIATNAANIAAIGGPAVSLRYQHALMGELDPAFPSADIIGPNPPTDLFAYWSRATNGAADFVDWRIPSGTNLIDTVGPGGTVATSTASAPNVLSGPDDVPIQYYCPTNPLFLNDPMLPSNYNFFTDGDEGGVVLPAGSRYSIEYGSYSGVDGRRMQIIEVKGGQQVYQLFRTRTSVTSFNQYSQPQYFAADVETRIFFATISTTRPRGPLFVIINELGPI